uniref:Uncharacterized protein n=1 Tax=Cannabis sativa TaxID=3483 RepID=A0A803NW21_CANSA
MADNNKLEKHGVKLFVFGDSYADTGNSRKHTAVSWKPPYGITFPGKPAGSENDFYSKQDLNSSTALVSIVGNDYGAYLAKVLVLDLYTTFMSAFENLKKNITTTTTAGNLRVESPLVMKPCCVGISKEYSCGSLDENGAKKYSLLEIKLVVKARVKGSLILVKGKRTLP